MISLLLLPRQTPEQESLDLIMVLLLQLQNYI